MDMRSFLHFIRRNQSLIRWVGIAVGLWLVGAYTDWWSLLRRMLHWMSARPVGWELVAIGLVTAVLLLAWWQLRLAKGVSRQWSPVIGVVTASGEAIRILLTEKKYPGESYWSGTTTDAEGEMHQLVVCQRGDSDRVVGHQVTVSLRITSARESIAAQFNQLFGAPTRRS